MIACCKWFVLGGLLLLPTAYGFEVQGEGEVVWVADGDSFYFKPDDTLMWEKLKRRARDKQVETGRWLRVGDRFKYEDKSFLVRVGNVNTAESAPLGQGNSTAAGQLATAFAKQVLMGTRGTLFCWDIGYYGRPICSFWTHDWEYGQRLIANDHSDYVTKYGRHPRFHKKYVGAMQAR
ncbi:hypothetical protein [Gilvimarinus polysaccharolyticus]|uniref:hypothetical protein n=1 Tax=Gilvimarinus polysaccharolyticus TaxID=863921 RepID=UPI000673BB50|nr:hypothetical protein [Gilvimarinus polysaccharolyticus]